MRKSRFIRLTLANGKTTVIIDPEQIALAMRLSGKDDNGREDVFTRIIPKSIVINPESNWLDVQESPEKIAKI